MGFSALLETEHRKTCVFRPAQVRTKRAAIANLGMAGAWKTRSERGSCQCQRGEVEAKCNSSGETEQVCPESNVKRSYWFRK